MGFWDFLPGVRAAKASQALRLMVVDSLGRPISPDKDYAQFAREGYETNSIGFRAISLVADSVAALPWELKVESRAGDKPTPLPAGHPALALLKKPNPSQAWKAFAGAMAAFYMISGNSYIEGAGPGDPFALPSKKAPPKELWPVMPDMMQIVPGPLGLPSAYIIKRRGREARFACDPVTGMSQILHMRRFHPTDTNYGLSPMQAASYGVDTHNEAAKWNIAMLMNDARPSGAFTVESSDGNPTASLTAVQFENLKAQIAERYSGSQNSGRPLLLEGGLKFQQMGLSQKDTDWLQGKRDAAREICQVFGVPPLLLNIPGDSTFSNYKEARQALYEDTVIPVAQWLTEQLMAWMSFWWPGLVVSFDLDSVPALAPKRAEKWKSVSEATFLTINEKREELGYEPIEGGDELLVSTSLTTLDDLNAEPAPPLVPGAEGQQNGGEGDQSNEGNGVPPIEKTPPEGEAPVEEGSSNGSKEIAHAHEVKRINLLTQSEKQRMAKRSLAARDRLESAMELDVREQLEEEAKAVAEAIEKTTHTALDHAAVSALATHQKAMSAVLEKHLRRSVAFGVQEIMDQVGKESLLPIETKARAKVVDFQKRFVERRTAESVGQITNNSLKKVKSVIKNAVADSLEEGATHAELAKTIREQLTDLSKARARTIARTETAIASNAGSVEAVKSLEIPDMVKEWVAVLDDRTRDDPSVADHAGMDGTRVGLDEKFNVQPDCTMDGPGDPSAPPEQIINCRCSLVYSRGK